jgi:hypothetical protein
MPVSTIGVSRQRAPSMRDCAEASKAQNSLEIKRSVGFRSRNSQPLSAGLTAVKLVTNEGTRLKIGGRMTAELDA